MRHDYRRPGQEAGRRLRCDKFGFSTLKGGRTLKMVNLTIDGQKFPFPRGTTIMQAAATVGIEIPRLCYLKGINEISACKVCVVEIQGQNRVVTACTTPVQEGLVVYTNSPKARSIRRTNVELILSQHDCMCATCVRSGKLQLADTSANDLGIYDIPYERCCRHSLEPGVPAHPRFQKCIKCMRCVQICDKVQKSCISGMCRIPVPVLP